VREALDELLTSDLAVPYLIVHGSGASARQDDVADSWAV
jgi:hypothetical protein